MTTYFERYNAYENRLVDRFHRHALWRAFRKLTNDQFIELLIQLGHLSNNFVGWYERAKQGLNGEPGKEVLRHIMRDEIPRDAPTHQDDRLEDLTRIGVGKTQALNTPPSARTSDTIRRLNQLVRYPQSDHDLRVLIMLRIAGEVLVAETYRYVVPALTKRFGMKPEDSLFYFPHFEHDEKGADGHTDSFDRLLQTLITDERTLAVAKEAAEEAFRVRSAFYDQFTMEYKATRIGHAIAAIAAMILVIVFGATPVTRMYGAATRELERSRWREFVANLEPSARGFYEDCDRSVARRTADSEHLDDLYVVGTPDACRITWGDGP